jgi:hypothetical protein
VVKVVARCPTDVAHPVWATALLNRTLPHSFKRIPVRFDRSRGHQLDAARGEGLLRLRRVRNAICQWNSRVHTPDLGWAPTQPGMIYAERHTKSALGQHITKAFVTSVVIGF